MDGCSGDSFVLARLPGKALHGVLWMTSLDVTRNFGENRWRSRDSPPSAAVLALANAHLS